MTIRFGTLKLENGKAVVVDEATLEDATINSCPNIIFSPRHYKNGSCDCFDKNASEMAEWGYRWDNNKKHWT